MAGATKNSACAIIRHYVIDHPHGHHSLGNQGVLGVISGKNPFFVGDFFLYV
jgi:hypothetical protein